MNKIDINTLLQTYSNECENYIDSILPTIFTGQEIIINSIRYSLFAGGKRIRPSLVYEFCSACEKDYKIANPLAAAVEMIHTYSLIHDDLPCMDNDDFRRGKPANHKVFGETLALLAGDGLLNLAFETALKNTTQINEKNLLRAIKCLSNYSGICGMIGGQIIDLESENKKIDENTLNNIHNLKTAALIKASCEMGCIVGDGNENQIKAAREYGRCIGLVFQIIDDVLDITSTKEVLGKPIKSDEESGKTTFVNLYGVEKSIEIAKQTTAEAIDYLSVFKNKDNLVNLANFLLKRKS